MRVVRRLGAGDAEAVERLLVRARAEYAEYSPKFWRPHPDAAERHTPFLAWLLGQDTTRGFGLDDESAALIATETGIGWMVDDFTVADPRRWRTDGSQLLTHLREQVDGPIEVVTAEADEAKVAMLHHAGFSRQREWWIGPLAEPTTNPDTDPDADPDMDPAEDDTVSTNGANAALLDAPPVYDPGGRVAMVHDWDGELASIESMQQVVRGRAALLIVPVDTTTPERRSVLERLEFHVASGWYRSPD